MSLKTHNENRISDLKSENQRLKARFDLLRGEFGLTKNQELSIVENKKDNFDKSKEENTDQIAVKDSNLKADISELQHRITENEKEINRLDIENQGISHKIEKYANKSKQIKNPIYPFTEIKNYSEIMSMQGKEYKNYEQAKSMPQNYSYPYKCCKIYCEGLKECKICIQH